MVSTKTLMLAAFLGVLLAGPASADERRASAEGFAESAPITCFPEREDRTTHYELSYTPEGSDQPQSVLLTEVSCSLGAYNATQFWLLTDGPGETRLVAFARPKLDIAYADEESAVVKSIAVAGFTADFEIVNSFFDEKDASITAFTKWRGLGDASSNAQWVFDQGAFVLRHFEADASYDGEINPVTIIENGLPVR